MTQFLSQLCKIMAIGLATLSSAQAITLDEVGTGELLFTDAEQQGYTPGLQLGTTVDIQVSGLVARVTVQQRFRNPGDDWAEARYVFPLPETAAVNDMRMQIGDRIIVGEIHEKQKARKIYEQAKRDGKRTALTEQSRPNMFSTKVANVGPGQEVSVTLTYLEKVAFDNGRFSLRFPMTITPRYIPGRPLGAAVLAADGEPFSEGVALTEILRADPLSGWAAPTDQVPDADEITPFLHPRDANVAHITATVDPGLPLANLASAWHDIQIDRQDGRYAVELANGAVAMDRDFELTWRPVASATPQAAVFTEDVAGDSFALVMVMPPAQPTTAARLPRESIFIIDTSGSMGGEPIRQAKAALLTALDTLQPGDRFNIIEFNSTHKKLFADAQLADGSYLTDARRFVNRLQSGGGTEMERALRAALENQLERERGHLRQVIFITDGAVGNEEALFRLIDTKLANSRLFTVGIGSAPNSYFMRKAAQFGRGTFTYIGGLNQVEEKMGELFARLEMPVLRNIEVNWPGKAESYPKFVPDLYSGQPLVMTAKLSKTSGKLRLRGTGSQSDWRQAVALKNSAQNSGIATLWARDRIGALSDQIVESGETDELRQSIIDVAILHRLVSRYTSFVAVEQEPVRPAGSPLNAKNVPNARPKGQSDQPFAYPQTATPAVERMWFGIMSTLLAIQIWWLRRRDLMKKKASSCLA